MRPSEASSVPARSVAPTATLWLGGARILAGDEVVRGAIGLRDGRVLDVAQGEPPEAVALGRALVLPGLVNGHDHLHLNVFPPSRFRDRYATSRDWVADMARAIDAPPMRALRALPEALRAWHGGLKNALAGATTVVHHDPWLDVFTAPDFPVSVVPACGWAHSLELAGGYGPHLAASHAATPPGRPWFVHAAEGTDREAAGELGRLAAAGCLDGRTRLVHGVGLTPADRRRALAAGAGLVWCPYSNAFLLGAIADPQPFAAAGRAAIGTDARLSGARDLLDELGFAARVAGCPPATLLAMATADGATLCGRAEAGRLAPGAPADLVVLADDGRPPADQLVGARRADLRLVVSRGRPVVADPDLAAAFEIAGEPFRAAALDGRPKLVAAAFVAPLEDAGLGEAGLDLSARRVTRARSGP